MFSIKFIGTEEELAKKIANAVFTEDMLKPAEIVCDAPEALWIEFGTGPTEKRKGSAEKVKDGRGKSISKVEKNIRDWVEYKFSE